MDKSRHQDGYLSLFAAFFLVAIGLALFTMYDGGRLLLGKTRLQQVADATAYSAAVLQSRELNFHANMNRAMISNQVAIGQMVSLSSYLQVNQQIWFELGKLGDFLQFIPYVGPVINVATKIGEGTMGVINWLGQEAGSVLTQVSDTTIATLSGASKAWHQASVVTMVDDLNAIAKANDPDLEVGFATSTMLGQDLANWHGFVELNSVRDALKTASRNIRSKQRNPSRERLDEFRQLVMDSRDGFTRQRNQEFWNVDLWVFKLRFQQRGGAFLGPIPGKELPYFSWSAVDTISLWVGEKKRKRARLKWNWSSVPLAWGRQATFHQPAFRWRKAESLTSWEGASTENPNAYRQVVIRDQWGQNYLEGARNTPRHIGHFKINDAGLNHGFGQLKPGLTAGGEVGGLRDFFDLKASNHLQKSGQHQTVNAATPINILLQKSLSGIPSANARSGSEFDLKRNVPRSPTNLSALAAGRAVFEPPWDLSPRPEKREYELANLYNPFWVPRLVPSEKLPNALGLVATGETIK